MAQLGNLTLQFSENKQRHFNYGLLGVDHVVVQYDAVQLVVVDVGKNGDVPGQNDEVKVTVILLYALNQFQAFVLQNLTQKFKINYNRP